MEVLYKVTWGRWNKLSNPLWDHLQYKILKDLRRNGARKAPSQYMLIWCIVPYGLEIINAMFPRILENILRHPVSNEWLFWKCQINSAILQSHSNFPNGLFSYIQAFIFSGLKLSFNFYVKRTVSRQAFGAKFNLTYHNGAPVANILKVDRESCYCSFLMRIKIIQIVLLSLLVYSPAFSFMSWWT